MRTLLFKLYTRKAKKARRLNYGEGSKDQPPLPIFPGEDRGDGKATLSQEEQTAATPEIPDNSKAEMEFSSSTPRESGIISIDMHTSQNYVESNMYYTELIL